jgi:hypothetical protein
MTITSTDVPGIGPHHGSGDMWGGPDPHVIAVEALGASGLGYGMSRVEVGSPGAFVALAPSGGFFAADRVIGLSEIFEACTHWFVAQDQREPDLRRDVVRTIEADVVARRRMDPPTIYDDDY